MRRQRYHDSEPRFRFRNQDAIIQNLSEALAEEDGEILYDVHEEIIPTNVVLILIHFIDVYSLFSDHDRMITYQAWR